MRGLEDCVMISYILHKNSDIDKQHKQEDHSRWGKDPPKSSDPRVRQAPPSQSSSSQGSSGGNPKHPNFPRRFDSETGAALPKFDPFTGMQNW